MRKRKVYKTRRNKIKFFRSRLKATRVRHKVIISRKSPVKPDGDAPIKKPKENSD